MAENGGGEQKDWILTAGSGSGRVFERGRIMVQCCSSLYLGEVVGVGENLLFLEFFFFLLQEKVFCVAFWTLEGLGERRGQGNGDGEERKQEAGHVRHVLPQNRLSLSPECYRSFI